MKARIFILPAAITALLLLIPLIAMQFTAEVNWTLSDFVVAAALLFGTASVFNLVATSRRNVSYRVAAVIAIATAFLLTWANLAVGILGSGPNPANLMYGGMIFLGIIAAILADFRSLGMSRVLFGIAIAQVLVPVIAYILWKPIAAPGEEFERTGIVIGITGFFAGLWVISGLLFWRAGRGQSRE